MKGLGGKKFSNKGKMGKDEKSLKARVNDHEKELAKKLGGRAQPASGAMEAHKGDVKLKNFLLDSKETSTNSLIISARDLTKITIEADGEALIPGLILTIDTVPDTVSKEWIAIPIEVFGKMVREKQDEGLDDC